ncbi:HAMP domain-containing sensor histidine kinase [Schumannella sp. 10F1B-5-1]|uniref:sensor histidine kinase n=1 Tax=Schumannella sp. 10F1B-5-1 TaxID=2590780 RepID=UPI0015E83220|nr:HAMP domain-containing sensor histidine kinase [Schumannella sp. 10F1B-5-1]
MRVRILVSVLLVAAIGIAAAGLVAGLVQRAAVLRAIDSEQSADIAVVADIAAGRRGAAPSTVRELLTQGLQQVQPAPGSSVFAVDDAGAVLIPGVDLPFRLDTDAAFLARVGDEASTDRVVRGVATVDGRNVLYRIVPVGVAADPSGGLWVIGTDVGARLEDLAAAARSFAAVAAIALTALGIVGWFVAGRLLRPLRVLREIAETASENDLDDRVPVRGRDDVSELAATVNRMLDRLSSAFSAQRQLADDVSHELRTPVTIVRGHLEVMDPTDHADVRSTRDLAIDELDRMSLLIGDLTTLARSDAPGFVDAASTDLHAFGVEVVARASALSAEHRWASSLGATGQAQIDARRLAQAWLELARNAAKYAPPGTLITLATADSGDDILVRVDDEGPGVPRELRTRAFERFDRAGRGADSAGSGLGLAIVTAIAQAHGGSASLSDVEPRGNRAEIRIPRRGRDEGHRPWHAS